MKFKFDKNLPYQADAIRSIVDIFDTGQNVFGTETIIDKNENALFENIKVIKNVLDIDKERIANNVVGIQVENKIYELDKGKDFEYSKDLGRSQRTLENYEDFSIEMETGTGKTYVYLRTIFELNKKYGLKKFIILVPSVAIREGVLKTLQQTKEHFKELYNVGYDYFAYDSKKLTRVKNFAQSFDIQIMIMTIQSFNKDGNIMRKTPDRFYGESPIDLVAQTRPIVIMDEPQNMESELSKSAISDLKPLFKLRYSATHKDKINLIYVLSPVDAYRQGLVKKIEVYGAEEQNAGAFVFKVKEVRTQKGKAPIAMVGLEIKNTDGDFVIKDMILKSGDDLRHKSKNDKYENLYVNEITAQYNRVELSDGKYYLLEERLSENKEAIFRAQIKETIRAHFDKQKELGDRIKVLSLFFIDKVENYIRQNGIIRKIFDEEYEKLRVNYDHFAGINALQVQNGYFACSKIKGEVIYKDTDGKSLADKDAYDLIMKDKERLLSFSEPTCFIFSHSALKEGWDNPNVFQICTLNETRSGMKKRQEIGRGMRLPVDVEGNRISDPQINILTVVANESYKDFVGSLQTEYDDAGYKQVPEASNAREKVEVKFRKNLSAENEDFKNLWERIKKKTKFNIELKSSILIENCVREINRLEIDNLVVKVEKVMVDFEEGSGKLKTIYENQSIGERLKTDIKIGNIVERIVKETGITKKTIVDILEKIENLDLIFQNPEEFLRSIVVVINNEKERLLINEGLKYYPVDDVWSVDLVFEDMNTYLKNCIDSNKSAYEKVVFDSTSEKVFAQSLEASPAIKLFVKLPSRFVVDTPLGNYNPDWAIVVDNGEGEKLYLVRETKFGMELENLRPSEQQKILCGEKHFAAIGVDFKVSQDTLLNDLK